MTVCKAHTGRHTHTVIIVIIRLCLLLGMHQEEITHPAKINVPQSQLRLEVNDMSLHHVTCR